MKKDKIMLKGETSETICWQCGRLCSKFEKQCGICQGCLAHLTPSECVHCMEKYERLNHGTE
jgi:predicted amidophosphoribosyltransferase